MKAVILFALFTLVAAKPESRVNVVDTPTMVVAKNIQVEDAPVETNEGFSVKVVNEAVDMPANVQEIKVKVVDLPEAIPISALENSAVKIVEEAINAPENSFDAYLAKQAAERLRPSELETIRINPEILNQVRVVDIPVLPGRRPVKVYPSPWLRNNH